MFPILYDSVTVGEVPSHFGLGTLTDCLSCVVEEERNGKYELTLTYPATGIHAEDILPNRIIKAKANYADVPQLFRIYKVGKTMGGMFTVYAQHITYDLSGKVAVSGIANSCYDACIMLTNNYGGGFQISTDKVVNGRFEITEPSSVRSWFGGKQGSLLDVYGTGEWHWDNFGCRLLLHRGTDRGAMIRYGKNLVDLSQELDTSNLVTAIVPYATNSETAITASGDPVPTGLALNYTRELAVDFSDDIVWDTAESIQEQFAILGARYVDQHRADLVTIQDTISLSFAQLEDLSERVDLCDTVHIYYAALGITGSAKCVGTTWDTLSERYTKVDLGSPKVNIADTIKTVEQALETTPTLEAVSTIVNRQTQIITGNRGGYVVLHDSDGDSAPDEILVMDTPSIATAQKVWRFNKNGLGYSANGYNGNYGLAMTAEGEIVADFIKAGVISDVEGNSSIDMTTGVAKMYDLNAIHGFNIVTQGDEDLRATFRALQRSSELILNASASVDNPFVELTASQIQGEIAQTAWLILRHLGETENIRIEAGDSGGSLLISNNAGKNAVQAFVGYAGGSLSVFNLDGARRGMLWVGGNGDGVLNLYDGEGGETISAIGQTGIITCDHVVQRTGCKAIDTSGQTSGSVGYSGISDYSVFIIFGRFSNTGSINSCYIPKAALTGSNQRFIFSDETDYVTFDVRIDEYQEQEELVVTIASKSKSAAKITSIYGLY